MTMTGNRRKATRRVQTLMTGTSAVALLVGVALAALATPAAAQVMPGGPECTVSGQTVTCSGDLSPGVLVDDGDGVNRLIVRDLTADIAPAAGTDGISFIRAGGPVEIVTETDDNGITVTGAADGIVAQSVASAIRVDNALDITNPSSAQNTNVTGIRIQNLAGAAGTLGTIELANTGDISITGLRTAGIEFEDQQEFSAIDVLLGGPGEINIVNTGDLSAVADGWTPESDTRAFAALIVRTDHEESSISLVNEGRIVFDSPRTPNSFGDFTPIGQGILVEGPGSIDVINRGVIEGFGREGISINGLVAPDSSDRLVQLHNLEAINLTHLGNALAVIEVAGVGGTFLVRNDGALTGDAGYGINLELNHDRTESLDGVYRGFLDLENNGDITISGADVTGSAIRVRTHNWNIVNTGDIIAEGRIVDGIGIRENFLSADRDFTLTNHLENNGAITASGAMTHAVGVGPIGIELETVLAAEALNTGAISVEGFRSKGIDIEGWLGVAFENRADIAVLGDESQGVRLLERSYTPDSVRVSEFANYDSDLDLSATVEFVQAGDITVVGENSDGVLVRRAVVFDPGVGPADASTVDYRGGTRITLESGTISGGSGDAAGIRYDGVGTHVLDNRGTITALSGAAVIGGEGDEIVLNRGTLNGTVALAAGDDTFALFATGNLPQVDGGQGEDIFALDGEAGEAGTLDGSAVTITGFERFEKRGLGQWTLIGGAGGLPGAGSVIGGTLLVQGQYSELDLTVLSGATLGGTGTLGDVTVANGGILAPGNSIGTLEVTGNLVLNQTSQLHYEIGAPGTAGSPGASDMIAIGQNLTLDGQLHLTDAGGAGIGHYRLMTFGGILTNNTLDVVTPGPVAGATYTIQTSGGGGQVGGGNVDLVISGGGGPVIGDPNLQYWQDASPTWTTAGTDWRNDGGSVDVEWAGNHGVFNGPGGTIAVEGAQSFRGLQFVTDGYLLAGTGTLQTVAGGSELRVLAGETATIATEITGTGGIAKTQDGTLILSGVNTYTGATSIGAGTLALQGDGSIASSSGLSFTAAGTFDVSAVTAGTTTIGTLTGVAGSQILLGTTDLVVDQTVNGTVAGAISGAGDVEKAGAGELILTGANIYAGLTTVSAGTLRIGDGGTSGSVVGNIANNASLIFDRSNDFAYDGVLAGAGDLTKLGVGMMTLTGNSGAYAGAVDVDAGNLRIASGGTLGTSLLTVGTNGTLSGLGAIIGNVSVLGTLAPGETALGPLAVTGNVSFGSDANFAVRIAGNGSNDALAATSASVAGDVTVTAIDPHTSYLDGQTYTILTTTAANGVTGTFNDPTMFNHSAFLTPTLRHNADNVVLTIAVTADFTTVAETFNQRQAAMGLNDLEQSGDALVVFNEIAMLNPDQARRAFDLSSGEIHASGQHVIDQTFGLFSRTLRQQGAAGLGGGITGGQVFTAPMGYGPSVQAGPGVVAIDDATTSAYANQRVASAWLAPLGGRGVIEADGNAGKLDWWTLGLAGGYEGPIDVASGNAYAGFGLGYLRSHGSVDARLSSFEADSFNIGAYGGWSDGPWSVAGALAYSASSVSTERRIVFGGIDRTAEADYWSHTVGFSGEAAYGFDLANGTTLSPLFTLDAGWSGHGGFTETGADALNLTGASESWTRLDTGLGVALQHVILTETGKVTLDGRLLWEHAFADVVPSQNFAFAGSPTGFEVRGPDAGRDRVRLGLGASFEATENMSIRAGYTGLFSGNQQSHGASLGLNVKF